MADDRSTLVGHALYRAYREHRQRQDRSHPPACRLWGHDHRRRRPGQRGGRPRDAGAPADRQPVGCEGILTPEGTLDRAALRHLVFGDREQLNTLNEILHPEISALRDLRLAEARERGDAVVVYAVPLLFERNLMDEFDKIVLVDAPRAVRMERLMGTREIEPTEAMHMIASQMPAELKRARRRIS